MTSDDVDLVEKRRLHLEIYLQQLLVPSNKFYKDCPELRQFLHQDEMPLNYKNALSRTVPAAVPSDVHTSVPYPLVHA